jgi:hypothetical protein
MIVRTSRIDGNQRYRSYAGAGGGKYHLVGINLTTSALETLMEARTVNNLPPAAPYRPEQAMDGWSKVFAFFGKHLAQ